MTSPKKSAKAMTESPKKSAKAKNAAASPGESFAHRQKSFRRPHKARVRGAGSGEWKQR